MAGRGPLRQLERWDEATLVQFVAEATVVERACLRLLACYVALDRHQLAELMAAELGLADFDSRNLAACVANIARKVNASAREPLLWSTGKRHVVNRKWHPLLAGCLAQGDTPPEANK